MKPYITTEMNQKIRDAVHFMAEYNKNHLSISRSYYSNDEYALYVFETCNKNDICINTKEMTRKVTWFLRADGARDQKALKIWGFNQHTA